MRTVTGAPPREWHKATQFGQGQLRSDRSAHNRSKHRGFLAVAIAIDSIFIRRGVVTLRQEIIRFNTSVGIAKRVRNWVASPAQVNAFHYLRLLPKPISNSESVWFKIWLESSFFLRIEYGLA